MSTKFKKEFVDWIEYRSRFNLSETDQVDFHFGPSAMAHHDAMAEVTRIVERALKEAQRRARPYLMFRHGSSTSWPGRTSSRSQVRGFMLSKEATALIERKHCIEHETVFVAKIRPLSPAPVGYTSNIG